MVILFIASVFLQLGLVGAICILGAKAQANQSRLSARIEELQRDVMVAQSNSDLQLEVGQNLSCLAIWLQVAERYQQVKPEKAGNALIQAKILTHDSLQAVRLLKNMSDTASKQSSRYDEGAVTVALAVAGGSHVSVS